MITSIPFTLDIQKQTAGRYVIRAEFRDAVWQAEIDSALPLLSTEEKSQGARLVEHDLLAHAAARDLGTRLFYTFFPAEIQSAYRAAADNLTQGQSIRLMVGLPSDLAILPWELLYDPAQGRGFIARAADVSLVRWAPGSSRLHAAPAALPIRVLVLVASPLGFPSLGSEDELTRLQTSLAQRTPNLTQTVVMVGRQLWQRRSLRDLASRLRNQSFIETEVLLHATRRDLQQALVQARGQGRPLHVVHFVGHSDADEDAGSTVVLEMPNGDPDFVRAEEFAEIVAEPGVVLVFLNSCRSAMPLLRYETVAQALLQKGVHAVLGMQTDVLDLGAVVVAEELYGTWAAGLPLEQALSYARRQMAMAYPTNQVGWTIPVLSMRSTEGAALDLELPVWQWPDPLRRLYRTAAFVIGALSILLVLFNAASLFDDLYQQWRGPQFAPLTGIVNVAVVDFDIVGSRINEPNVEAVDFLVGHLFTELDMSIAESAIADFAQVVHIPTGTSAISEEGAQAADIAELATQLHADIVIYGTLDVGKNLYYPAFYVSPRLTGAEESTGDQAFGQPIPVTIPLPNNPEARLRLLDVFVPRVRALSQLVSAIGLFKVGNYDASVSLLGELQALGDRADKDGKEILYLWLGTNYLRRADNTEPSGDFVCALLGSSSQTEGDCAHDAYAMADKIYRVSHQDQGYARAAIGIGNYYMSQAWDVRADRRILRCEAYVIAAETYAEALETAAAAHDAVFAELKAYYNIGTAYATAYRNGCQPQDRFYAEAVDGFEQAVSAYDQVAHTPVSKDVAARSYYQLGVIQRQAADDMQAEQAFKQVLQVSAPLDEGVDDWQAIGWKAQVQIGHLYTARAEEGSRPWWQTWGTLTAAWRPALAAYDDVIAAANAGLFGKREGRDQEDEIIFIADAYTGKGRLLNFLGDFNAAEQALLQAIRPFEDPDNVANLLSVRLPWAGYLELGRSYTGRGRLSDALSFYARITQSHNDSIPHALMAEAHLASAKILIEQGETSDAVSHLEGILELVGNEDPLYETAMQQLRQIDSQ